MPKFRKKPVVIEAMHFNGSFKSGGEIMDWAAPAHICYGRNADGSFNGTMCISTLEGEMRASAGDYIIKGVSGEFYPCKPDIFEQTYERVED